MASVPLTTFLASVVFQVGGAGDSDVSPEHFPVY